MIDLHHRGGGGGGGGGRVGLLDTKQAGMLVAHFELKP